MGKNIMKMSYKIQWIVFIIVTVHCINLISLCSLITEQERPLFHRASKNIVVWNHFVEGTKTRWFLDRGLHPPENTVMVNIGDMMQRWTSDTFISTVGHIIAYSYS